MSDFKKLANNVADDLFNGKSDAREKIIDLFQKKIYNLAFRYIGDRVEASDLSQEIFLRLFSKIHLFKPGTDFHSWFMRLAVNSAINYRWKLTKNNVLEFSEGEDADVDISFSNRVDKEHINYRINSLLRQLPERERLVIIFQTWESRSIREIAEIMETSNKAVEALLTRARKRLRKLI